MDFITGHPSYSAHTIILTVVDRFSKTIDLVPLTKLPSAKGLSNIMAKVVFRLHCLSKDIVSDGGPQFISKFWRDFSSLLGVSISLSSRFHPQSGSQTKRAIQKVETKLRLLC